MCFVHEKLVLADSVFGPGSYGDSYLAIGGDNKRGRPLVTYIGGSINDKTYESRRGSEPVEILKEYLAASESTPLADLMVCPFPSPSRTPVLEGMENEEGPDGVTMFSKNAWQSILRERFSVHLVSELLRAREAPLPSSLAFVGFSAGAYLAVCLALDLPKARGAAIFGGTGMSEALVNSGPHAHKDRGFLAVAGEDDPLAPNAQEFAGFLGSLGVKSEVVTVRAGHSFA